jgi:hypothetical protein
LFALFTAETRLLAEHGTDWAACAAGAGTTVAAAAPTTTTAARVAIDRIGGRFIARFPL